MGAAELNSRMSLTSRGSELTLLRTTTRLTRSNESNLISEGQVTYYQTLMPPKIYMMKTFSLKHSNSND